MGRHLAPAWLSIEVWFDLLEKLDGIGCSVCPDAGHRTQPGRRTTRGSEEMANLSNDRGFGQPLLVRTALEAGGWQPLLHQPLPPPLAGSSTGFPTRGGFWKGHPDDIGPLYRKGSVTPVFAE
jgi:hypothetical protein